MTMARTQHHHRHFLFFIALSSFTLLVHAFLPHPFLYTPPSLALTTSTISTTSTTSTRSTTQYPTTTTSSSSLKVAKPAGQSNGFDAGAEEYSHVLIKKRRRRKVVRRKARQKLFNRILNLETRSVSGSGGFRRSKNEDGEFTGYEELMRPYRPLVRKLMKAPFKLAKNIIFPEIGKEPGQLILVRHGESTWNFNKTFTGWADPDLSPERGYREAEYAARLLLEGGYEIDVVFTSRLKRAIRTAWIILSELNQIYLPVFKSWRLNERMYGALTGLSKTETAKQLGTELVQEWRGSLRSRPPALQPTDMHWPGNDRKHADLSASQIPLTESLFDCMERTTPVWEDRISYELRKGRNVLVVAHANTLRGLVKIIDNIGDDEIQDVTIPTGIPIIYKFDNTRSLKPRKIEPTSTTSGVQQHMSGLFLEKPGLLKEALKLEEEWRQTVPGYSSTMTKKTVASTPIERSLAKLRAERELGEWAGRFIPELEEEDEDDGSDGNNGKGINWVQDNTTTNGSSEDLSDKEGKLLLLDEDIDEEEMTLGSNLIINNPCQKPLPSVDGEDDVESKSETRKDATIVIIRHGKTGHNKLGLFTGWADVPLATDGIEEAKKAGQLLKAHGFEFDVVYTSWLSRAIDTAWIVMDELDTIWLPIIKSWRLNERMYGDLTGLSKQMVKQRHGDKQFKAWRRGFKVRPPKVSSFSQDYPGNDLRYKKFMKDIRYSASETLIRSIEGGTLELHRKYPKSESLRDCMSRTIPYFETQIAPQAMKKGKRVLIASSENAIRGLLMYLCDIPEEKIVELEIPNSVPLVFDINSKCIKLLDDGSGISPLEKYNFGKAANYLFRPCLNEDGTPDEECDITYMSDDVDLSDIEQNEIDQLKSSKSVLTEKVLT